MQLSPKILHELSRGIFQVRDQGVTRLQHIVKKIIQPSDRRELTAVAQFESSVIPTGAAFQAERGISLKIMPGEIPPAAELRRGSG